MPLDSPIQQPRLSFDRNFYRDTARALFPTIRNVRCYELYTMHVGLVPVKYAFWWLLCTAGLTAAYRLIVSQNWRLVCKLRESRREMK